MTVLADARPFGLDLLLRPATTITLTLSWPTGSLAGRTFTSTLNGQPLALTVNGDVMTIVATDTITGALTLGEPYPWELRETIDGTPEPIGIGTWAPDDDPHSIASTALTVTVGQVDVDVTVNSAQASIVALDTRLDAVEADVSYLHRQNVYIPSSWGQRWYQARTEAGARQVKVHLWGDSITEGVGATDKVTLGWAGRVRDALRTAYGDGGSGFLPHGVATKTGTWLTIEPWGPGMGGALCAAVTTATMQWTGLRGTRVRLFFRNANITGSFRWRVDGGSFTTVTPPTGFGLEPGMVEATGLADVPHIVDVEWVSGTAAVHGVLCDYPTGVVVARCASGLAASQFSAVPLDTFNITLTNGSATITTTAPGRFDSSLVGQYLWSSSAGLPFDARITAVASATSATIHTPATAGGSILATVFDLPPSWRDASTQTLDPVFATGLGRADLVVISIGVNDLVNIRHDSTTFRTGLSRILSPYFSGNTHDYSPDVVGIIEHRGDYAFDLTGRYPEFAAALADVTRGLGGAVIDMWGIGRRSYKHWLDLGYFTGSDGVHPTDTGHAQYAAPLVELLTGSAPS